VRLRELPLALARRLPPSLVRWLASWQFRNALAGRLLAKVTGSLTRVDTTIRRGSGCGLAFNAAGTDPGYVLGTTEPDVQSAFVGLCEPGAVVLDVGANVGFFTLIAAKYVGPGGRVVAFEPVDGNLRALRHNLALNDFAHVDVHALALGSAASSIDFLVGADPTKSRAASIGAPSGGSTRIRVDVAALYDLIAAGSVPVPDVIKMDIEGAEIDAVAGMQQTLRQHRPVLLCEMHGRTTEFVAAMDQHGYTVSAVEAVGSVEDAPWWVHLLARPVD
jgi:FkbM family methyltransferase